MGDAPALLTRIAHIIGVGERAASRAHVTGYVGDDLRHYEVATFVATRDGLALEMTEVWTRRRRRGRAQPDHPLESRHTREPTGAPSAETSCSSSHTVPLFGPASAGASGAPGAGAMRRRPRNG